MLEFDAATEALRARLATERLLTQQRNELATANSRIAEKARVLTDEVIAKREAAEAARHEAERLKDRTQAALRSLRMARSDSQMAQRRLWASLEAIEDGFAVFDRDRRIIAANRAFFLPFADLDCVALGTSHAELVDIAIEEGVIDPGERRPAEWAAWMKARWDGKTIEPVVLRLWNNTFVRLAEQRTEDGDMVVLASNITAAMKRERELVDARRRAEAASRAKSTFLANMSHEIRTPMNGVLAMVDLLAEGTLSEEQRLCVDTIRSSGEALLVIINDVLDYSKIEAQKLALVTAPFDLEATINEVIVLLQPAAREKALSLVVDYDMFLPTGFRGDKGRIRQILMNLVGNAVKFTETGHVLVRVVGLPDADGVSHRVHVTVEDTGIGIPAELHDHIFGEFNQADADMTRQFDGTGLGLAITRRLVSLMGGELWVESEPGDGAVFGFSLVLPATGETRVIDGALPTAGRRVLLCDPDPASRAVLSKQMMALGLRPECSADPGVAEAASLSPEDLLVVARPGKHTGTVAISRGPQAPGAAGPEAAVLNRPVLRADLLGALERVLAQASGPETPAASLGTRRVRVLAAEDNKTNQIVLRRLLKDADIDLVVVENGRDAVEAFAADPAPDIVFTDISMPVMNGKDAARAMRRHEAAAGRAPVPIVAMTAHALDGDKEEILAAGIDHYMAKPLRKEALLAHIDGVRTGEGDMRRAASAHRT